MSQSTSTILFIPFICVMLIACGSKPDSSQSATASDSSATSTGHNNAWTRALGNPESLRERYVEDAIRIDETGLALNGVDSIVDFYSNKSPKVQRHTTKATIIASRDSTIYYELAEIESDGNLFDYVIVGRVNGGDSLRLFEFVSAARKNARYPAELDERRQLWMTYCNNHQVGRLVDELYAADPIYYNHKPLVRGKELLKQEYSYMESKQYHLTLAPIHIEPVSEIVVYEIGQCNGSYGGKYILIWQRERDGQWRII
jgi:ketosteroid isomerase-like protein